MKFSQAQSEAYFELCKYRIKNVYLTWVEQFLDLIEDNIDTSIEFIINDIGCNLGQFYKGLKRRNICKKVEYYGLDNSEKYLKEAKIIFPDIKSNFININICETPPPLWPAPQKLYQVLS